MGPTYEGARGFRIDGAVTGDSSGWKAAGIGDQNNDGFTDIEIAAPNGYRSNNTGKVFVVYVKPTLTWLDLSRLDPTQAYEIDGITADEHIGASLAGVGDLNG